MGPGEWGGCNGMPDVSFQRIHMGLEYITIQPKPIEIKPVMYPAPSPFRSGESNEP